jgi:hypothetical protein
VSEQKYEIKTLGQADALVRYVWNNTGISINGFYMRGIRHGVIRLELPMGFVSQINRELLALGIAPMSERAQRHEEALKERPLTPPRFVDRGP